MNSKQMKKRLQTTSVSPNFCLAIERVREIQREEQTRTLSVSSNKSRALFDINVVVVVVMVVLFNVTVSTAGAYVFGAERGKSKSEG